jgi:ATP dependent DNA ligase domain
VAGCSSDPNRTDWTDKYSSAIAALANLNVKTAYLDGELCGVDESGLPSFAHTQAATDGESGARLVHYAFDLLHLDSRDVSRLPLIERKTLLEPPIAGKLGLQFNGHETGDGELILQHAGKLGFEGVVSKTIDAPYTSGNRGLWCKAKWLNRQGFVVVGWTDPEGSRPHLGDCRWAITARMPRSFTPAVLARECQSRSLPICAPPRAVEPSQIASECPTFAEHTLRIAAGPLACPLGRAGACRRDHLSHLETDNLLRHTV